MTKSTKSTIKEQFLYDTSLIVFFSLVRKERKGQKEERIDFRLGDADRVRLRESVNSREVRHSLTWHSSKSESALERFEPVAADKLRLDGSLAMFAPRHAPKLEPRGLP